MMRNCILSLALNALLASAACPFMDPAGEDLLRRDSNPHVEGDDGFMDQFTVDDSGKYTTTDSGTPVDDFLSLKAGERGPTLLEDFVFRTKIQRFDHERIPERAVHARGAAAHGYFESYADWSNLTAASFLSSAGKQTPIFLRISTVAGSRGSADSVRDVHGFSLRFYTDEGNYDIVGNNIPVFFIQDAIQFPDLIHAVKPQPDKEVPQAQTAHDTAWDFFSSNPSSLHTLMWALSGHGIPRSLRHVDGFGVHTFRWVNDEGKSKLIKYHFKTQQGLASLIWAEALNLAGQDPDFHRKDLWDSIENGDYPEWEVNVQIVDEEDVLKYGFDMLDPTKILPVELAPLVPIGKFVLNKNPRNYFAETEQVMFCPGHVVRGIDFTDDPLLQGRLFSYVDTQLNRNMGSPNFEQIPINRPRVPVHNNNRDGAGQQMIPLNIAAYTENTLSNGFPARANMTHGNGFFTAPARKIVDANYVREVSPTFLDYWTQPRLFYNSLEPAEQQQVVNAARFELSHVESMVVRQNAIDQFNRIDNDLAKRVASAIGIDAPEPDPTYYHNNKTSGVSVFKNSLPTIKSMKVGILASINSPSSLSQAAEIRAGLKAKGATGVVIAESLKSGVNTTYTASDAVLFDGIVVADGTQSLFSANATMSALFPPRRPLQIVQDAFYYGKPVGVVGTGGGEAFTAAAIVKQEGVYTCNSTSEVVAEIEEGLKQFKFLGRFPVD